MDGDKCVWTQVRKEANGIHTIGAPKYAAYVVRDQQQQQQS
jgi:hypothetical protein